ncbi:MAG: hypothetical protein M3O93_06160 [Chloroflexota bacterium]|nr:hypothetical protein [Chloroflexota bacterium]
MDVATNRPVLSEPYTALARATGIIGIVFMVLLFGPIIALSTAGEPPLDATPSEAVKYFGNIEANWAQLAMAASTLGWIGSLWFFVAFGYLLRRVEGDPPWRSTIATLSGALLAAYGLVGVSLEAASLHGGKITPDVADFAFAFGSVGFANAWIAVASFALCSGWVVLSTRALERWMGWWLIVAGLGLVAARFVWTRELWTVPYLLFWVWVLVLSIRLIHRPNLLDPVES